MAKRQKAKTGKNTYKAAHRKVRKLKGSKPVQLSVAKDSANLSEQAVESIDKKLAKLQYERIYAKIKEQEHMLYMVGADFTPIKKVKNPTHKSVQNAIKKIRTIRATLQ